MKNNFFTFILFLFSFHTFSAQNYDVQWKKIEENTQSGKVKSNLPLILDLQNQAMKDDNAVQLIRSLKAEYTIVSQTEDDEKNNQPSNFFAKLKSIEPKLKGDHLLLYQVLVGEFFVDYYNQNQWQINQRTAINNQDFSQIEAWSKLDFKKYLSEHFKTLNAKSLDLQKMQMEKYKSIFQQTDYLDYFPTVFDWNAIKEIAFYNNSSLFTPNEIKNNQSRISSLYSELIQKNSGNAKLYFQHQKLNSDCGFSSCKNKSQLLQQLINSATEGDYKVMLSTEIIDELLQKQKFNEALSIINSTKQKYPKSKFLPAIQNQENRIVQPTLIIHYESNTQPNLPIHLVAEAKNVSKFSLNIYEVKDDAQNFLKYVAQPNDQNKFSAIKKSLVRKENFNLEDLKDYKTHKTSLEILPLPAGIYLAEYVVDNAIQQNFYFIASHSRIISNKKFNKKTSDNQLQWVNRENGKWTPNENLNILEFTEGNKINSYAVKADPSAIFKFPVSKDQSYYRYYLVQQPATNDFQLMQVYGNRYDVESQPKKDLFKAQIFLDRAIYRPGQLVYFKVINTKLVIDKESVAANLQQKISLFDANDEEVSSQTFTSNSFGSYHGSFSLPQGKLNGEFSLRIEENGIEGYKDFKVEEYKRPKFEVSFEKIKEEYKYGETIELKGKAMSFSGVALSNSIVNYEIKKQNIRWRYFWWYPRGDDNENSILGETKTNDKGEFIIKIDLKKDESLDGIQVDNYEVNASVTDINGETQSANENVKVASVSHYIKVNAIPNAFTDKSIEIKVETKNYNDQNIKKPYQVKLTKLQPQARVFRSNFENQIQDLPKYSKAEFVQKFPHDYFSKEEQDWKPEKVLMEKTQQPSANSQQPSLDLGKLSVGNYKLELYNVEGKDTIKTEQLFEVFDRNKLDNSQKSFLKVVQTKTEFKRNEKGNILIYSAVPDALVNIYIQNGKDETITEQKKLNNGFLNYELSFPKDESIILMNVQVQLVAYNDVHTETVNLKIATDKKPLRIETVTFRDKLQPGQKEKWTVKILGQDNEKIYAEVLANMYDKSLDQFAGNSYVFDRLKQNRFITNSYSINENLEQKYFSKRIPYLNVKYINVPDFSWFDRMYQQRMYKRVSLNAVAMESTASSPKSKELNEVVVLGYSKSATSENNSLQVTIRGAGAPISGLTPLYIIDGVETTESSYKKLNANEIANIQVLKSEEVIALYGKKGINGVIIITTKSGNFQEIDSLDDIEVRQNLNETAFFYPNLLTDKDGNVTFEFTSPEALTQWKLMFLAHTQDARSDLLEKTVVTQKEFSVTPNYPRFLREGDELNLQSKVSNLTQIPLKGVAKLQILDAFTNDDISNKFKINEVQQSFELKENGNGVVAWKLKTPKDVSSIIIKIVAQAGNFSDGEQKAIAILPNRMLVTDALPIFVKEGQTKTFVLENLAKNTSTTATNFANSLELTTNPIWEIMLALPSLKNDTNLSADVVFNKWFADVLAAEIFKANPKLKSVFEQYQSKGVLISNLEKNQELKQLLLEETPWILESKNETQQMEKLSRLFDANMMRNSLQSDWDDLQKLQNPDGGFSWYSGYPSSYYNSLYILKNLGKINRWLKGNTADYQASEQKEMVAKLVNYVDGEVQKYWDIKKEKVWDNAVLDYLDTRNYWEKDFPLKGKGAQLKSLVINQAPKADIKEFTFFGLHRAALLFHDYQLPNLSKKMLTYLKETSVESQTQGVYWKQNLNDWGWYSSKTVNQAGALETFQQLTPNDINFIEEMKIWLVTQKEVSSWGSSRGTAEVIFTILNSGKSWTTNESDKTTIVWGASTQPSPKEKGQSATGYIKQTIKSDKIEPNLGTVTITKPGAGIVQGGLFWQYYEDLDQIKSSESYLSITKELYKKIKTENGEELVKISENTPLKVGDKVTVRMILNTDRAMQFVHLKDMRAAGFEPLKVISGYEWKNGLGYYQSTKDASTNFYIETMPKGKFVFEYDYICNASGTFSNGITTLQNYYAPQMNAHSKGEMVKIGE